MKKVLYILSICCLIIIANSCSSNKQLSTNNIHEITAKKLIKAIEENNFDFETMQAKLSVDYEASDSKMSLKGLLRMEKDSVIWISLSLPMGLEVMRVMITDDSVFVLNKAQKKYLKETLDTFNKKVPFLNLQFAQSLLIGNDYYIVKGDDYTVNIENDNYNLFIINRLKQEIIQKDFKIKAIERKVTVDSKNYKIKNYKISELTDETKNIYLEYNDFQLVGEKYLPTEINIIVDAGGVMKIKISYSNVAINEPLEYRFSIPKKYTRM